MMGYLQSQDRFVERLKMGPDEGSLASATEAETGHLPLIGIFSSVGGRRVLFYRWDGELSLRVGDELPIRLGQAEAEWTCSNGVCVFTLSLDERQALREVYPLSPEVESIDHDPTPMVEAEDFDLFLFVHNVLHVPGRSERIFRNS
jgi:hypothetical protein